MAYSPYVSRPHLHYPAIMKEKRTFFFQPQQFQAPTNSHGQDVLTMLEHCSHLAKGMTETMKRSGGSVQGWIVLPSYDHHVDAAHYLSCQSVSFIRDIKKFIKRVVVFQQVQYQIPYMAADGTISIQQSRKQLQNQVALLLNTGKGNLPMGKPITMDLSIKRDLNWGMSRLNLESHVVLRTIIYVSSFIRV